MSQKRAKKLRKEARLEASRLIGDANARFIQSIKRSSFMQRLRFCWRILFL